MTILVFAAHPDDEVYGAGGTIARFSKTEDIHVVIVTDGSSSQYENYKDMIEKKKAETAKVKAILGIKSYTTLSFKDMHLDVTPIASIAKELAKLVKDLSPNTVLTHYQNDLNADHRKIFEATKIACRPYVSNLTQVLSYEVPSTTELGFRPFEPKVFVDVSGTIKKKIDAVETYQSEIREYPHPRSPGAVEALSKVRGYSSGYNYAEGFEVVYIKRSSKTLSIL